MARQDMWRSLTDRNDGNPFFFALVRHFCLTIGCPRKLRGIFDSTFASLSTGSPGDRRDLRAKLYDGGGWGARDGAIHRPLPAP